MRRRSFLALATASLTLTACGIDLRPGQTGEQLTSRLPLPEPYRVPLPVPPVARRAGVHPSGADLYTITQRVADAEILPGVRTPLLTYDGTFPGPTLETRRDRPVVVRHRNELPVPTVVHLHGGHVAAEHDGWPLDLVLPVGDTSDWSHGGMRGGQSAGERDYAYPLAQRAATLWYHDHRMDFTGPAVYRGLAGFHLVRDAEEDALPMPRGDRELPLMIADRAFGADGELLYPSIDRGMRMLPGVESDWSEGVLGDVNVVNGVAWPVHEVDAARYRLRIVNAANARRYRFTLNPALPFTQIGSDHGLLAAPVEHDHLDVAPGERFDVVVDFGGLPVGTEITMLNALGSGTTADVLRFCVVRTAVDDSAVPDRLSTIERLDVPATPTRTFTTRRGTVGDHRGWTINDGRFDPDVPAASVPLDVVERWRFVSDLHHPLHVHLDPFQVVGRGDGGPGRFDGGWKDTVDVLPGEVVDIAVRFTTHRGRFVFHCHNLEHEDMAMMARLDVV